MYFYNSTGYYSYRVLEQAKHMITDIYAPLSPQQIIEGGFDPRSAAMDKEIVTISEEEDISYFEAMKVFNDRYKAYDLVPTSQSYDSITPLDQLSNSNPPVVYGSPYHNQVDNLIEDEDED